VVNANEEENWDVSSETSKKSVPINNPIEENSESEFKDRRVVAKRGQRYGPPPVLQLQTEQQLQPGPNAIIIDGASSAGSIKCYFILESKIAERANISVNVELLGVPEDLDQRQADALERMAQSSVHYKKAKGE
jgi:hypothetical protein